MLTIRMQRTGRKGHAMFRVVVQDARRTPTSGKIVALLGNYDPHSKTLNLDKKKAVFYLEHGAQPSNRAARILKSDGIKLPGWVKLPADKERTVRNPEKRRSTAPAEAEKSAEEPQAETSDDTSEPNEPEAPEANADETTEAPVEQQAAEAEAPAEPTGEASAPEPETADKAAKPEEEKTADENEAAGDSDKA